MWILRRRRQKVATLLPDAVDMVLASIIKILRKHSTYFLLHSKDRYRRRFLVKVMIGILEM